MLCSAACRGNIEFPFAIMAAVRADSASQLIVDKDVSNVIILILYIIHCMKLLISLIPKVKIKLLIY